MSLMNIIVKDWSDLFIKKQYIKWSLNLSNLNLGNEKLITLKI